MNAKGWRTQDRAGQRSNQDRAEMTVPETIRVLGGPAEGGTVTTRRNVDPEAAHLRARLGKLTRDGNKAEAAQVRTQLDRAVRMAALRRAVGDAPPLTYNEFNAFVELLASRRQP
ncbi:hypothetical protein AB0M54_24440 [Actinoplanes sp. NPDC051470]|uniref:hypothetical protein n=1 Tax=Actinoplanes sp. NPDC051470 TaxID=3157224 RepID=UPI0034464366